MEEQLSQVLKENTQEKNQQCNASKLLQMKQSQTKIRGKTIHLHPKLMKYCMVTNITS